MTISSFEEEHFSKVTYSLESNPFGYEVQVIDAKAGKFLVTHTEMHTAFLFAADANGWFAKPGFLRRPNESLRWGDFIKVANIHTDVWTYDVRDILEFLDWNRKSVMRKRRIRLLLLIALICAGLIMVFQPNIL